MHKLARCVRFSINPFLPADSPGCNSFASKPSGEGLSLFFELSVELAGEVDPVTGFVVNVTDIDKNVRDCVVPIFSEQIRRRFKHGQDPGFYGLIILLKEGWKRLAGMFGDAKLNTLSLKLNPFRKISINSEDCTMAYFSEKFEFAAMHKLWAGQLSDEQNLKVFGKCANPTGHGHNYIIEVTVKTPIDEQFLCVGDFEKIVDDGLIRLLDHKNLNADVSHFAKINPTVENIAVFAWNKLAGRFGKALLHSVTVWETDKTCCSYYGN